VNIMAPPMSTRSHAGEVLEHRHLARDLRAADDRGERTRGLGERAAQVLELLLHEEPRGRRPEPLGHADGRGMARCAVPNASLT
jgi:hypothetical protein